MRPAASADAGARLDEYVESASARWLTELTAYCRIPSVSAQGRGLGEAADWVEARLRRLGGEVRRLEADGAPPAVFARLGPETGRPLLIYNHYDVQPPEPLDAWTTPPFEPTRRDGRLYARGVADNKANFLSRVQALEALAETGGIPLSILWLVEGEEEVGSPHLASYARDHGAAWAEAEGCLWETGSKDAAGRLELYSGCKGLAAFELRVRTAAADSHSALATLLPNAAWRLVWALASIKDADGAILLEGLEDHVAEPSPEEQRHVEAIPFDARLFAESHGAKGLLGNPGDREALRRHLYAPTCTINGLAAGYAGVGTKTVLPAEAMAKLDFRLVPDLTPELVEQLLRDHLARGGFGDVEVVLLAGEMPVRGDVASDVVGAALAAVREVTGREAVLWPHMPATGPMYPLTSQFGIPVVGFGTGYYGSAVHAPDENVRLDDYFEGVRVAASFFRAFAQAATD